MHSSRNATPWPYGSWLQTTRRSIGRVGLEIPAWLLDLLQHLNGALPPFLTPVPTSAAPALEGELTTLRAMSAAQVRADLDRCWGDAPTPALQALHERPAEHLARLADVLLTYWDVALSQHATGIRSTYEEEIFARSRILATEGPERLLDSLDAGLPRPGPPVCEPMSRVRIVPLLFGRGPALMATGPDGVVCFSYQARGAAVLSGHGRMADTGRKDRLEILLGRSRAAVMRAVIVPSTTSALAAELGLAASTVSEHLAVLVAAGVVKRRRVGIRVLYELDQVGMPLMGYLGGDSMDIAQADCA